jgi:hypothetical protein
VQNLCGHAVDKCVSRFVQRKRWQRGKAGGCYGPRNGYASQHPQAYADGVIAGFMGYGFWHGYLYSYLLM